MPTTHTIDFEKYKKTPQGIYYIDTYHPWREGQNELWNDFSAKILDLKKGKQVGISYFMDLMLERTLYKDDYTIVTVPPSDPAKDNVHGTKLLVKYIVERCGDVKFKNGTDCLVRTRKVAKSVSGDRRAAKHLESIKVEHSDLIVNRTVLLIDDVTTTGNSLKACQGILLNAHAKDIVLLALAHTG